MSSLLKEAQNCKRLLKQFKQENKVMYYNEFSSTLLNIWEEPQADELDNKGAKLPLTIQNSMSYDSMKHVIKLLFKEKFKHKIDAGTTESRWRK